MSLLSNIRKWLAKQKKAEARPVIPAYLLPLARRQWGEWAAAYPEASANLMARCRAMFGDNAVEKVLRELMPESGDGGPKQPDAGEISTSPAPSIPAPAGSQGAPAPTSLPGGAGTTLETETALLASIEWLTHEGRSYARARVTCDIFNVRMEQGRVLFAGSPPMHWPVNRGTPSKPAQSVGILCRKIGGRWKGGKVEWNVIGRQWFDAAEKCAIGYNGHTMPAEGEPVLVGIGHEHGIEISNLTEVAYHGR